MAKKGRNSPSIGDHRHDSSPDITMGGLLFETIGFARGLPAGCGFVGSVPLRDIRLDSNRYFLTTPA
jgi:hypothetical protein